MKEMSEEDNHLEAVFRHHMGGDGCIACKVRPCLHRKSDAMFTLKEIIFILKMKTNMCTLNMCTLNMCTLNMSNTKTTSPSSWLHRLRRLKEVEHPVTELFELEGCVSCDDDM